MTSAAHTLSDQLAAVMAYRNRPEDHPEPLQSNWTVVAANDNADATEIADMSFERNLLVTPSVEEIMRQVKAGPEVRATPEPKRKRGRVISIGTLRFSDGKQTEKAHSIGPDGDVVQIDRRMPLGSMLGAVEKPHDQSGGKGITQAQIARSNEFFAASFNTYAPRFVRRTARRNGRSLSQAQSRALLDDAIANTKVMPPVRKFPAGLPCGAPRVSESFLGMQKAPKGQGGSIAWQDVSQTIENAAVWRNMRKALKAEDVAALDAAMRAQTYSDIDPGGSERGARARGKKKLHAANDNLAEYLRNYAG